MTLEKWNDIVGTLFKQIKLHPRLVSFHEQPSREDVQNYLGFYAFHGGLFIDQQDQEICGIMTVHPGCKDIDWTWNKNDETVTVSVVWANSKKALSNLVVQGLKRFLPKKVFVCRNDQIIELTPKKLQRMLIYGKH